jgi:hypothetical protein
VSSETSALVEHVAKRSGHTSGVNGEGIGSLQLGNQAFKVVVGESAIGGEPTDWVEGEQFGQLTAHMSNGCDIRRIQDQGLAEANSAAAQQVTEPPRREPKNHR